MAQMNVQTIIVRVRKCISLVNIFFPLQFEVTSPWQLFFFQSSNQIVFILLKAGNILTLLNWGSGNFIAVGL